jgi:hypothetical protein
MKAKAIAQAVKTIRQQYSFNYGDTVPESAIMQIAGIKELTNADLRQMSPSQVTKRVRNIQLEMLTITDRLRDELLNQGKYFRKSGDFYEVALPSENMAHVEKYRRSAMKKLNRADKLLSTTPAAHRPQQSNTAAKILIAQQRAARRSSSVTVGQGGVTVSP